VGDAAEDEERDPRHREAAALRDEGVGELVEEDGEEEEEGGGNADGPVSAGAPVLVAVREEPFREGVGEEGEDQEPRRVDFDVDAEDAGDAQGTAEHAHSIPETGYRRGQASMSDS